MRVYQITVRNKAAALAIGATVVIVGGALVAVGLTLLAGLALGGAVLGTGAVVLRRLTGRPTVRSFDPALEVFAPPDATREIGPRTKPASPDGATGRPASLDGSRARGSTV
jgi:hypothetical protein